MASQGCPKQLEHSSGGERTWAGRLSPREGNAGEASQLEVCSGFYLIQILRQHLKDKRYKMNGDPEKTVILSEAA